MELLGGFGDLGLGNEGEQTSFLDADDAPSPLAPLPAPAGGKGGRPKGARNRSTEEWRQFFLSKHQAPVMVLGGVYSRAAEDLARALYLTRVVDALAPGQEAIKTLYFASTGERSGEVRGYLVWDLERAFNLQMAAVTAALPYINQKQPLAIETKTETRGVVILGSLEVAGAEGGDDLALPLAQAPERAQQNQQVIDVEPEKSHAPQSHDAPNPLEYRDE